jgi:hypothetical protein
LPPLPYLAWTAYCTLSGEYRWELYSACIVVTALAYGNERTKRLLVGIQPAGHLGLFYDSMRFFQNAGLSPARIHVCDLRDLDARLFAVRWGGHTVAIHDLLRAHQSLALDVFFSIPYGTFLYAIVLCAVFLYFRDYAAMGRFTWGFLVMNVVAFATYHAYPAAAPWYYHAHGCVADLGAHASEGSNLAHVDAWLGVAYFRAFYGRSHDVFGAIPSLHVAYPLLIVLEGWRAFGGMRPRALGWSLRGFAVLFFAWMCVAAIYLDHHWVLDVVVGIAYALVVFAGLRALGRRFAPVSLEGCVE